MSHIYPNNNGGKKSPKKGEQAAALVMVIGVLIFMLTILGVASWAVVELVLWVTSL
jgi:hypothetical protein